MAIISEDLDAAAGITTTYSMRTGDIFYGTNPDADHDWLSVYLEPGYHYIFRLMRFTNSKDHVDVWDSLGNAVETYSSDRGFGVSPKIETAGTYYIDVFGMQPIIEDEGVDQYYIRMTEGRDWRTDGTSGSDVLVGGTGEDAIRGYKGKDALIGGDGNDWLQGGKGPDRIEGGEGRDYMRGGFGRDVFVFKETTDSLLAARGEDNIFDFRSTEDDKVNLRWIDAKQHKAGNNAFTFIGTGDFSGKQGEIRYDQDNINTHVYGDVDGDGVHDIRIRLKGKIDLVAGDFVL